MALVPGHLHKTVALAMMGSERADPESISGRSSLARSLRRGMRRLGPREQVVLHRRFYEDMTLSEVGGTLGVTSETARLVESRGLRHLRQATKPAPGQLCHDPDLFWLRVVWEGDMGDIPEHRDPVFEYAGPWVVERAVWESKPEPPPDPVVDFDALVDLLTSAF